VKIYATRLHERHFNGLIVAKSRCEIAAVGSRVGCAGRMRLMLAVRIVFGIKGAESTHLFEDALALPRTKAWCQSLLLPSRHLGITGRHQCASHKVICTLQDSRWRSIWSMKPTRKKLIDQAEQATGESKYLDFKSEFGSGTTEAWCGVVKDIVAMANSGGGIIIFGVDDDGSTNTKVDHISLLAYDTADITNQIFKYTGHQFSGVEIIEVRRRGKSHACFLVAAAETPVIFTRPGEYETADKKKKFAFAQGTLYFRHGSKSEPGNRDDLLKWRDREIERARKTWMTGIRKVVETAPTDSVTVIPSSVLPAKLGSLVKATLSADRSALRMVPANAEEIWPHRQSEVIRLVNKQIDKGTINSHDITCIKFMYNVSKDHPEFVYKSHKLSSPQYSQEFVDWLVEQYFKNKNFFLKAREGYKAASKADKRFQAIS
jgi:hypothetical protein